MKILYAQDAITAKAAVDSALNYPSEGRHCQTGEVVRGAWTVEHRELLTDPATQEKGYVLDDVSEPKAPVVLKARAVPITQAQLDAIYHPIDAGTPEVG